MYSDHMLLLCQKLHIWTWLTNFFRWPVPPSVIRGPTQAPQGGGARTWDLVAWGMRYGCWLVAWMVLIGWLAVWSRTRCEETATRRWTAYATAASMRSSLRSTSSSSCSSRSSSSSTSSSLFSWNTSRSTTHSLSRHHLAVLLVVWHCYSAA